MSIRILDSKTINRIAAGEVIDRPASVVKELIENSIDAKATEINITIENSGRNLIIVEDNGSGIIKDDIELAFIRHATSKLHENDLTQIKYLGFRGEALPSIAAVGRVKLISKSGNDAWEINYEGGDKVTNLIPASLWSGTYIEVRDLFFATPSRLKFLKTERAETQYIVDIVNRLAISQPNVALSLTVDGKTVFKYTKQSDLLQRLCEIKGLGKEFKDNSILINYESSDLILSGYVSLPTFNRGKSNLIFTFVNGRAVTDNLLLGAVKYAYSDFITRDRYPIVVLNLFVPYSQIDVNVHPHKSEVRFQNHRLIYFTIVECIKKALGGNSNSDIPIINYQALSQTSFKSLDIAQANLEPKNSVLSEKQEQFYIYSQDNNDLVAPNNPAQSVECSNGNKLFPPVHKRLPMQNSNQRDFLLTENYPLGFAICQLHNRYIIAQSTQGLIIVDQHAAHERLVYEYIKKINDRDGIKRQILMIPELIELEGKNELELLMSYKDRLLSLGLVIEAIGENIVLVREVPAMFGSMDVKSLITNLIDSILEVGELLFMEEKIKDICAKIACYGSIRSGRALKNEEMNTILRQMESTPYSGQCNHGRPTYIQLKLEDIDKLFKRI